MKNYLFPLLFVALSSLSAPTITFAEEKDRTLQENTIDKHTPMAEQQPAIDAFPLELETISWVEVTFRGGLLKKYKSRFERLIRRKLRKDLPTLSHEIKPMDELRKEFIEKGLIPDLGDKEFKKRGCVNCFIWTTGEDNLAVFLIECKLVGYGEYENPGYREFESRILDYGSTLSAPEQVEDSIKRIITRISAEFSGARNHLKALSRKH
jgi:hypothetical protein